MKVLIKVQKSGRIRIDGVVGYLVGCLASALTDRFLDLPFKFQYVTKVYTPFTYVLPRQPGLTIDHHVLLAAELSEAEEARSHPKGNLCVST